MSIKQQSQFEKRRLRSLNALEILDTAPDKAFDNLVELAAQIAGVPISLVSLVAEDRQWFKACVGLDVSQTPIDQSFCAHAIKNGHQPLIVCDAESDPRFANNRLVVGEPFIRFYAGFPIKSPSDGMPLGTLCVIDQQPRELDQKTIGLLTSVARQVESLLSLHQAVSQQRKAKEEHVALQNRLGLALETGSVALWDWDAETDTVYASPTYKKQLGIAPSTEISDLSDWMQRLNPKDKDEVLERREAYLNGESDQFEMTYRMRHCDGFYRWIFARGRAEFDSNGKPLMMLVIHLDVTEQREAEKAIEISKQMAEESERRFRGLADSASIMIWTTELDSTCSWLNQRWVDYCGKPLESQLGFGWADTVHPDDRQQATASYQAAFDQRIPFRWDYRLRRHDGEYRWFTVNGTPRFDQDGSFAGFVGLSFDVHDDRIREQENRLLSAAIKNSKDAFLIASVEADANRPKIVFINEAFTHMTGYLIDDLDQSDFRTFLNGPETEASSSELIIDQIQHWQVVRKDMLLYNTNGAAFWANVKMAPLANDENVFTHWLVVYRDITDRMLATAALKSVSESRKAMVELLGATDGVWDWDLTNNTVEYQPGYRKVLGYDKDDQVGLPDEFEVFEKNIHPEDRDRIFAAQRRSLKSDIPFDEEFRLKKKDDSYIWVHDRAAAIFGDDGKTVRMTGSIYDITGRKKIEAALERERRLLKESNADLQQFASVASHDLQEPLRAVSGFLQLIESKYAQKLDDRGRGYIQKSVAGAARMSQLINDLLLFSRVSRSSEVFALVDLNDVVAVAQQDLDQTIATSQTQIEVADLPTIKGVQPLLVQLFRNLIGNSIKYRSPANPRINISFRVAEKVCQIRFQDNGIGIPDAYRHQVFELFKRLHRREQHPGTGIGLAICKRVVERHGGSIEVEPNESPGTCFVIRLPTDHS